MTRLLTVTCERQLPGVFSHQLLKSFQRHNFPECRMNRFGARFHPENFSGFVCQPGIQPYRCHCHSHGALSQFDVCICPMPFVYTRQEILTVPCLTARAFAAHASPTSCAVADIPT